MKRTIVAFAFFACSLASAGAAIAGQIEIAALVKSESAGADKPYTPAPKLAQTSSCSISCGGQSYSTTCSGAKQCVCTCNGGCVCR